MLPNAFTGAAGRELRGLSTSNDFCFGSWLCKNCFRGPTAQHWFALLPLHTIMILMPAISESIVAPTLFRPEFLHSLGQLQTVGLSIWQVCC